MKKVMQLSKRIIFFFANTKIFEAELNFENLEQAAKAAIMSCFSLYAINFYDEALSKIR